MSWRALNWANEQCVGHAHSKAVLLALANYADERGTCFPSHQELSRVVEVSVRTVQECVARLLAGRYVSTQRDRRSDGKLGLTRYRLHLGRSAGALPAEAPSAGPPDAPPAKTTGSSFRSEAPQESAKGTIERESARRKSTQHQVPDAELLASLRLRG